MQKNSAVFSCQLWLRHKTDTRGPQAALLKALSVGDNGQKTRLRCKHRQNNTCDPRAAVAELS